jgi:hypothetical protein
MSTNCQIKTNCLYMAGCLILLFIIISVMQLKNNKEAFKDGSSKDGNSNDKIAVKTDKGVIKIGQNEITEKLDEIKDKLKIYYNVKQYNKELINSALDKIKLFIKNNPKNYICDPEIEANIIDQALYDHNTYDKDRQYKAHNTILDNDDVEKYNDVELFQHLLLNIDVLIRMLRYKICDNGVLDIVELERIIYELEKDLEDDMKFDTPIGQELSTHYNPHKKEYNRIFIREFSQVEPFETRVNSGYNRNPDIKKACNKSDINIYQTRSEMFRTENKTLCEKLYSDNDLLN